MIRLWKISLFIVPLSFKSMTTTQSELSLSQTFSQNDVKLRYTKSDRRGTPSPFCATRGRRDRSEIGARSVALTSAAQDLSLPRCVFQQTCPFSDSDRAQTCPFSDSSDLPFSDSSDLPFSDSAWLRPTFSSSRCI